MSEPLPISVLIPTFNRASLVGEAMRSVLAQDAPAAELWVIDDGSTDDTRAQVQALIQEHQGPTQIHYLYQDNAGVSAARNLGIARSTQAWIALLDSDDRWLPEKLKLQWQAHQESPDVRLLHTEEIWIRRGKRVNPKKKHQKRGGHIFMHCLPLCCISPSSALLHRSLFEELGPFDPALVAGEDYDLWLRICSREAVEFIETPLLVKYGGHEDQLSAAHWGMDRFRVYALEKLLLDPAVPLSDENRQAAHETLRQKLEILMQGALKRDRGWLALRCRKKLAFWAEPHPPTAETPVPRIPTLLTGDEA